MTVKTTSTLQAQDLMSKNPVCVSPSMSAHELAEILESNGISGVPVLDALDRVVGVVSKTDLIQRCVEGPMRSTGHASFFAALAEGFDGSDFDAEELGVVEDFMTTEPVTARPDEVVGVIAQRMASERVHRVVVVDGDQCAVGIITTLDLLKVFPT